MGCLNNKRILVTGIANNRSISYGISKVLHKEGADLAFTYYTNRLQSRVHAISEQFNPNSSIVLPCNVEDDSSIEKLFVELNKKWDKFDGFVHSIAFAPKEQLQGDYVNHVTREGFAIAHNISSYSFVAMAKACRSMLNKNASLITLTYLGSTRVIPNYNVMGVAKASLESNVRYMASAMGSDNVRVNAISAGPVRTLASAGIFNFKKMLSCYQQQAPIQRNITTEEIGNVAAFLCSDLSSAITGEIIHVDGGFNIISYLNNV